MPHVKGVGYVLSDPTVRAEHTKTECLEALKRLAAELGRTPMTVDVNQCRYAPSYPTYLRVFGSFPEAQRQAGLSPSRRGGGLGGVTEGQRTFLESRRAAMVNLFKDGATMQQIGEVYGVTRERVRQLIRAAGFNENPARIDPPPHNDFGSKIF